MANAIKGEVALLHSGKTYTMILDFNALAEFEEASGCESALDFIQDEKNLNNARMLRLLFWAGLKQRQPEMTLDLAGQILTSNLGKLGEAMGAIAPDASDQELLGNSQPALPWQKNRKRRR